MSLARSARTQDALDSAHVLLIHSYEEVPCVHLASLQLPSASLLEGYVMSDKGSLGSRMDVVADFFRARRGGCDDEPVCRSMPSREILHDEFGHG